jgi:hypothetical protein
MGKRREEGNAGGALDRGGEAPGKASEMGGCVLKAPGSGHQGTDSGY